MRKGLLFLLLLILPLALFAAEFSIDLLAYRSTETNIFSNPLPQNGDQNYINNVLSHPYLNRTDWGGKVNFNVFFVPKSRAGLSLAFAFGMPHSAKETIPVSDSEDGSFSGPWHYEESDALERQNTRISISLGGIFRATWRALEFGASIRGAVSTFDNFSSVTAGIEAEPFFKTYFRDFIYITVGASFTAHIFRFIEDERFLYDANYTHVSLTPYVGVGLSFGGKVE